MEMNHNTTEAAFHPNEYVSYGSSGVCQVISLENRSFDGEHEESYYKLRPLDGSHSTYYVPIDRAADRLRPLLTKEQIYGLIDEMAVDKATEAEWCNDSRERRGIFQSILHSDDYREMIQMMHTLHQQQERKRSTGHKLAAADEAAMRAAETRMYQEFGIVLNLKPDQVHSFIVSRLASASSK